MPRTTPGMEEVERSRMPEPRPGKAGSGFGKGWTYAADDSRDGGGRVKQDARAEAREGRERLVSGRKGMVAGHRGWKVAGVGVNRCLVAETLLSCP
ncbi:hypothetical protein AAY24_11960 [Sedimenticola thiotaurini]|uniref:Uncharacterized protein n=1 Tax=Sedimenticola thiotaurini TaxID=1543721 RepID=A0A0F7K023_9GAMM|nr:hypothetical protein AAY24_11960 [Sedimenticola thiotaurini]